MAVSHSGDIPVSETTEREKLAVIWPAIAYAMALVACSAGFVYVYCRVFGISRRLVLVNIVVVSGALVTIFSGFVLLLRIFPGIGTRWISRTVTGIILAGLTWSVFVIYIADYAAYRFWGNNINYLLVQRFFSLLFTTRSQGMSALRLGPGIYLVLVAFLIIDVILHLAISRRITDGISMLAEITRTSTTRLPKKILVFGVPVLVGGYAIVLWSLPSVLGRTFPVEFEPLYSFFRTDLYDISHDRLADSLRVEEPKIRAAYPTRQTFEHRNVVLIIVDSLRADRMHLYGYQRETTPFLDELYASGKLKKVEVATSTCAESNCGILSTLGSKNLRSIVPEDFKLSDLLHDQGYTTNFILSGDHEWYGLKEAYGNELTYYFDGADSKEYPTRLDDRLLFEGLRNVGNFSGRPAFFYFHLMSVHFSGIKLDEYRHYQPSTVQQNWKMLMQGKFDPITVGNNYDNGVLQADSMIRKLFTDLNAKGYLKDSLVVMLADHGEGLGDHGSNDFGHVHSLYQEFIRIPLLIYDDTQQNYPNLEYGTQIDVAPTILDRLGLKAPVSWQGESLLQADRREFTFHQTTLENPAFAVIDRRPDAVYKYLYRAIDGDEQLFELRSDPAESRNLINTADPKIVDQLRAKLAEYRQ